MVLNIWLSTTLVVATFVFALVLYSRQASEELRMASKVEERFLAVSNTDTQPTYTLGQYIAPGEDGCNAGYTQVGSSTECCLDGYTSIADMNECVQAAQTLGYNYRGGFDALDYTKECSHRDGGNWPGVWFNSMADASYDGHSMTGKVAPICKPTYTLGQYIAPGQDGCNAGYTQIGSSTECCLPRYTSIADMNECLQAAQVLGYNYRGGFDALDYTKECSHRDGGNWPGVWFNSMADASYDGHSMTGRVAPICKTPSPTRSPPTYTVGQYIAPGENGCNAGYTQIGSSTECCLPGYTSIAGISECEQAAQALGYDHRGSFNALDYTKECSHRDGGNWPGVWFNSIAGASYDGHSMTGKVAPICKVVYTVGQYIAPGEDGCNAGYTQIGSSTECCLPGYTSIAGIDECQQAAKAFGFDYRGGFNAPDYTKECSHRDGGNWPGVWFNSIADASYDGHSMTGRVAPMCKAV